MESAELKTEAARAALSEVESGMRLGIGTGSTAEAFVHLLAEKVRSGMEIIGVPTSERTAQLCEKLSIPLSDLERTPHLDLTVDGADEIDGSLALIKGGGGALLREKIVAAASDRMIVIADASKLVETLGQYPLPIEVNLFGLGATSRAIERAADELELTGPVSLRMTDGEAFVTDGGHYIMDASFGRIPDTRALSNALYAIPGVVEHGLFLGLASKAFVAGSEGINILERS